MLWRKMIFKEKAFCILWPIRPCLSTRNCAPRVMKFTHFSRYTLAKQFMPRSIEEECIFSIWPICYAVVQESQSLPAPGSWNFWTYPFLEETVCSINVVRISVLVLEKMKFKVRRVHFQSYRDVTIADEDLQKIGL